MYNSTPELACTKTKRNDALNHGELELSVLRSLGRIATKKRFLKVENFYMNENKNQYRYLLTQVGVEEKITLTTKFIQRKKGEFLEEVLVPYRV
ncbi:MAG: hypothetical protein V2A75_03080 [Pseudomonadota bacterium]